MGTSYEDAIQAAIQKEEGILGPTIALRIARNTTGMEIGDGGTVSLRDDGKTVLKRLTENYMEYGGSVSATLIARELEEFQETIELPDVLTERL